MTLVDTSAWIEYFRSADTPASRRIRQLVDGDGPIRTTEPVEMELIAGAGSTRREQLLFRLFASFPVVTFDAKIDFRSASAIDRRCRSEGVTPRGMVDCMIAAVALRHGVAVLAHDRDFARMAAVVGLELDPASLGA